ncbi:methane monooxygenase [Mycolicibacterium tusciae]|uniref:methane monooxygenase n=1 Tax=Mycolicibacterium tusciae TaxID=75922 RepID=UPI001EF96695|nr:methane monooxygenase [Mycolicibacterium tusciae]
MASPKLEVVHEKSKRYDWGFDYARPDPKFPTRYIIPPKGKDPFRSMLRGYAAMESEKDNRVYGGLDSNVRYRNATTAEPRFIEGMKFGIPSLTDAEYQAACGSGFLIASMKNQELRQGYAGQMLDEVRHTQIEVALRKYYLKNYHDPAGFDIGQIGLGNHPVGTLARASFQPFNTGDPVEVSMCMNIVLETAYTNPLVVALPQVAAVNGEHAMPTAFLSIQSDESRHMANGYGTLMSVIQEHDNLPFLQESLDRHFWHQHQSMDTLVGVLSEYFAVERPWAYKDVWEEWVVDDFVGSYMSRLSPFGLKPPARLGEVARFVNEMHHSVAIALAAMWPPNFWRTDPMGPADYEWFENHYPGWTKSYGGLWDAFRDMSDPSSARILLQELPAPACVLPGVPRSVRGAEYPCT